MNSKNIAKHLSRKLNHWADTVQDAQVAEAIRENAIVTGGALVSLLTGSEVHDYDVYFKTYESCLLVAEYYAKWWNDRYPDKPQVEIKGNPQTGRIKAFIESVGVAMKDGETGIDDESEPVETETVTVDNEVVVPEQPPYRPRYFSTNAISLSDKIQLVIRFYGSVDEIHENYDFVHCTCSYDFSENKVNLPVRALEAIINKELFYTGSKYPLCSIIRTRKFIQRGWFINAGQYLKMCLQLNELDLKDLNVFEDQLAGVDSYYFSQAIKEIGERQEADPDFKVDNTYLFEVINRIF